MKSTLAFLSLIVLGTAAGAAQLPNQTLYIRPVSLDRKATPGNGAQQPPAFTTYVAYDDDPTTATGDDGGAYGIGTEAMTEDVAVTLKGLTLNHVYKCDAHVMNGVRSYQIFQLNNCK